MRVRAYFQSGGNGMDLRFMTSDSDDYLDLSHLAGSAEASSVRAGRVLGTDGNDVGSAHLASSAVDDGTSDDLGVIIGLQGVDQIVAQSGAELIDGGLGRDLVMYAFSESGVNVNLASGFGRGGDAEGDFLIRVEDIVGSDKDDTLN